jgi:hypothetical protein
MYDACSRFVLSVMLSVAITGSELAPMSPYLKVHKYTLFPAPMFRTSKILTSLHPILTI